MKIVRFSIVVILLLLSLTSPSVATTITGTGKSDVGTSVQFSADMSITGNNLIIILNNTSSVSSTAYNDALSSFFFDIVQNGIRPTLTLTSATGTVYKGVKSRNDTLYKSNYSYSDTYEFSHYLMCWGFFQKYHRVYQIWRSVGVVL